MPRNNNPTEALALINKAITNGISHLHKIQGSKKPGNLHLMVTNRHTTPCLGCPHYGWKVWIQARAKRGPGIGEAFPIAADCKAPTRSAAAQRNPKVMEIVRALLELLEQRANLVENISRAQRSASATFKKLEAYAS